MTQQFSPDKFMQALQDNQLPPQQPAPFPESLSGFTRNEYPHPDYIEFSPGTLCWSWHHFPLKVVDRIEYLGMKDCPGYGPGAGHQHAAVVLHLKPPAKGDEVATAYYEVLQAVLSSHRARH